MQSKRVIVIEALTAVATIVIAVAVIKSRGPSKDEVAKQVADSTRQANADSVKARAARTQSTGPFAATKVAADSAKHVADNLKAHPCPAEKFQADTLTGFMTLAGFQKYLAGHACDPYKQYFDSTGAFRDDEGTSVIASIDDIWHRLTVLKQPYERLPDPAKRAMLPPLMKMVAGAITPYVNAKETRRYLLNLEWERDVNSVNAEWLESVRWPDSAAKTVTLPGYGEVSHLDVKFRMFWKRRGREMFEAAKVAFGQELSKRIPAPATKKK